MYIERDIKKAFHKSLANFPAVLITGPRQSGKSTFLQHELPKTTYLTFDDPLNRSYALQDPNGFLDQFQGAPVILDEIQYVPEILQYVKIRIDKNKKPGIWIMTGSQQFHLMKNINETLAGRIAVMELSPFSLSERHTGADCLEDIILAGLFPEPSCYPDMRDMWLKSYIQTYIERDVRQLDAIRDYHAFERFISLCAAFHSQEFHPASLARDCGVSQPTIKSWSKILEAGYIAMMLPPFFQNYGKRIIKAPKFYMIDPAIACYLTRQPSPKSTIHGSMGGAFFEGLIIVEVWKSFYNSGMKPAAYFWRSQDGLEVDLIIQAQGLLWPVEIKLTATPLAGHLKPLNHFKKFAGAAASDQGVIVCRTDKKTNLPNNNLALPWQDFPNWLLNLIR